MASGEKVVSQHENHSQLKAVCYLPDAFDITLAAWNSAPCTMLITILLWILAVLLVLAGLAGLVLPMMPGAPLLFAGLLLAAWIEDFLYVGVWTLAVIGGMALLTYVFDLVASALGARHFGASTRAIVGATLGAVVGIFFGLIGILVGPFTGAVIGELSARRTLHEAGRAGLGASLGLAIAAAGKLALGFMMVGLFLLMRLV